MEPEKTKAVRKWPTPKMVKEVQAFLGFTNYYRQFIRNYSWYTTLLIQLTWKDQVFKWEFRQEEAFKNIKALFHDKSILQIHNPDKKLVVKILREPENILQKHNPEKK